MLADVITALGPKDPDDGDEGRQRRGIAIAAIARIEKNCIGYKVPSQSGNGTYVVNLDSFVERPVRDGLWSARVSGREAPRAVGC